jgi:hypothetical protein
LLPGSSRNYSRQNSGHPSKRCADDDVQIYELSLNIRNS